MYYKYQKISLTVSIQSVALRALKQDTQIYSPLCVRLSGVASVLVLITLGSLLPLAFTAYTASTKLVPGARSSTANTGLAPDWLASTSERSPSYVSSTKLCCRPPSYDSWHFTTKDSSVWLLTLQFWTGSGGPGRRNIRNGK